MEPGHADVGIEARTPFLLKRRCWLLASPASFHIQSHSLPSRSVCMLQFVVVVFAACVHVCYIAVHATTSFWAKITCVPTCCQNSWVVLAVAAHLPPVGVHMCLVDAWPCPCTSSLAVQALGYGYGELPSHPRGAYPLGERCGLQP